MGTISPTNITDGSTIDAADVNNQINTIVNEFNGGIDNANIASDAAIAGTKLASSALDSESESLIQDALWKLIEGRTAIVIAHRLSTIQKMDRIIVLKDGKIEEEGSHKELLLKGGVYAELWQHQTGGFLEE